MTIVRQLLNIAAGAALLLVAILGAASMAAAGLVITWGASWLA